MFELHLHCMCTSKEIVLPRKFIHVTLTLICVSQDNAFSPMINCACMFACGKCAAACPSLVVVRLCCFSCAFLRASLFLHISRADSTVELLLFDRFEFEFAGVPACFGRSSSVRTLILYFSVGCQASRFMCIHSGLEPPTSHGLAVGLYQVSTGSKLL